MHDHDHEHASIISELADHFKPVLESSPDGVYLWLDDKNMVCNENFAKMFGYDSAADCTAQLFLETFIDPKDQQLFGANYQKHVASLTRPITFRFIAKKKDGSTFMAETDMIPASFAGHVVAYHFVREVKG